MQQTGLALLHGTKMSKFSARSKVNLTGEKKSFTYQLEPVPAAMRTLMGVQLIPRKPSSEPRAPLTRPSCCCAALLWGDWIWAPVSNVCQFFKCRCEKKGDKNIQHCKVPTLHLLTVVVWAETMAAAATKRIASLENILRV